MQNKRARKRPERKIHGTGWLTLKKANPFCLNSPAHPSALKCDSQVFIHWLTSI